MLLYGLRLWLCGFKVDLLSLQTAEKELQL
nr:MAG TPA: hypothetical protein [Caudoviricetes sp.]